MVYFHQRNKTIRKETAWSVHFVLVAQLCLILCDPTGCSLPGSYCEAARVITMAGSLDLTFGFPQNGKIPYPHQVTWSQPINMRLLRNKGRAEKPVNSQVWKKPVKVCTNKIALQICNQST